MMMLRRVFLAIAASVVLAGCMQEQIIEVDASDRYRVVDVQVSLDAKPLKVANDRNLTDDEVTSSLRSGMLRRLKAANPEGQVPVVVVAQVTKLFITDPGLGLLLGSTSSSAQVDIQLIDARSRQPVSGSFEIFGSTPVRPTIFGAVAVKSPEGEVALVGQDLGKKTKIAIFGENED